MFDEKAGHEQIVDEARFYGAFGFYTLLTLVKSRFCDFPFISFYASGVDLLLSINQVLWSPVSQANSMLRGHFDTLPNILSILWRIYYCILIEKMGMTGSHPPPHGYFIPDVIVAGVIGLVTGWCFGPLLPIVGKSLAKPSIIQVLLHGSIVALALSSQFFPYSNNAPKRIILQHSIQTTGRNVFVRKQNGNIGEEAIPASEKEVTSSGNQDNEYDGIIVTTDNDLLNVSVCEQSFVLPMESMTMISSSYDAITVGLNVDPEICIRMPLFMTEDLLQNLVLYRKSNEKSVSSAARSLLKYIRGP
ncbi:hypothetical protein ACS0TY_016741 [Phlomoides rotata]